MERAIPIALLFLIYCIIAGNDAVTPLVETVTNPTTSEAVRFEFNSTGVDLFHNVRFFLYTRKNPTNGQQLWLDDKETLSKIIYDYNIPTKFVVHGWNNNYTSSVSTDIRDGLLNHDNYNVVVVDWGNIATKEYTEAASRVKVVGGYIAKMVTFLIKQGSDINNVSLVGHSLGAQIVGLAGHQMDKKVAHIVGLDPAKPGFELYGAEGRIDASDAMQVEIIHSNKMLAMAKRLGHLDFYPNGGGPEQPGCFLDTLGICAHARSYYYYVESLRRPDAWLAIRCDSYENFLLGKCENNTIVLFPRGQADFSRPNGAYTLRTRSKAPFGLGKLGVETPPLNGTP